MLHPGRPVALAAAVVLVALVVLAGDAGSTRSPAAADSDSDGVVVTVPTVGYTPRDDLFRVGPYRSRLHVLYNDAGTPAPGRLRLVDARGRLRTTLVLARVATVRVAAGYVVITPAHGARGTVTFSYQAASPNGPTQVARARVKVFRRVIVVADDAATLRPGHTSVSRNIAANDRVIVAGAVRRCPPALWAQRPRPADPQPIVLPEPARKPVACAQHRTLTTKQGRWRVTAASRVQFTPAKKFSGTATAHYRQASDYPFDLGVARMSVTVRSGTAVLGNKADHTGGPLAPTGANLLTLLGVGTVLAWLGYRLRADTRQGRQPRARKA